MAASTVLLAKHDGILALTLNRPEVLNSFNDALLDDCTAAFRAAAADAEVRAVVVTGAGRGFCAGQDLADVQAREEAGTPWSIATHIRERYNPLILAMRNLGKPIVAAVNGAAAGAGMSFALAADVRVASEHAKFVQAFVGIGLVPDSGSSWFLPRLVGPAVAYDLCATGRAVGPEEALRLGLVSQVVAAPALLKAAHAAALALAKHSPAALARIQRMLNASWNSTLEEGLELEAKMQEEAAHTPEYRALVEAFVKKAGRK